MPPPLRVRVKPNAREPDNMKHTELLPVHGRVAFGRRFNHDLNDEREGWE